MCWQRKVKLKLQCDQSKPGEISSELAATRGNRCHLKIITIAATFLVSFTSNCHYLNFYCFDTNRNQRHFLKNCAEKLLLIITVTFLPRLLHVVFFPRALILKLTSSSFGKSAKHLSFYPTGGPKVDSTNHSSVNTKKHNRF